MGAFRSFMIVAAFGLLSSAVAATAQATVSSGLPGYKTFTLGGSAEPQAPALPSARAPVRQPGWVQRDGYVPVPDALLKPEVPAVDPNALPPANQWASIDLEKPFADDPLGTNVYADTKYAPANVRAAIENKDEDPTAAVWATPKPQPVGGAGMGGGMGGGMGMGAGDSAALLQQSYAPSAPVAAPSNDVFTGGSNGFNNRYQASVQNAMGSSDLMVQMIVEAPEQQVALGSDIIRQLMGQRVNTMPNRIFVYSTRTINNPKGEPFTAITYLMKNNLDVERSRQANTFGSSDQMNGFIADVAKATKLRIAPGSIKVSNAVNDGGLNAPAAPGAGAVPGQLPGQMMPGAMPGAMGVMPGGMPGATAGAPTAAAPAAPAKSNAGGATAGVLTAGTILLAAVLVF